MVHSKTTEMNGCFPRRDCVGLRNRPDTLRRSGVLILACFLVLGSISGSAAKGEATDLFDVGQAHLANGKYQDAIEAFTQCLLRLGPDSKDAALVLLNRAQSYVGKGDLEHARNDLNRAMSERDQPDELRVVGLHILGSMHFKKNQVDEAVRAFTTAIKTPHSDIKLRARSFSHRGTVFVRLKEFDKAVSDLNKAIELDSTSAASHVWRGFAHLRNYHLDSAERDAKKALALNPDEETGKLANQILKEVANPKPRDQIPVEDLITLPVDRNGHVFVSVCFKKDGERHKFMLDTGATYSLVSHQLLQKIREEADVKVVGQNKVAIADGSVHTVTRYSVNNAYLLNSDATGGLPLGEIEIHAFGPSGNPRTNLLGVRSLQKISFSIDTARRVIELRRNEAKNAAGDLEKAATSSMTDPVGRR
ncbi:MAG: tetratricopeptide repeat protein [Thermodesulfobacteriota bacterium]